MERFIDPLNFFTDKQWRCIKNELDSHPTPNIVIDLAIIEKNYLELAENFPYAKIYYSVQANPDPKAMSLLADLGAYFSVSSIHEYDQVLQNGGSPEKICYGNPIKKREDIEYVYNKGCRLFASDCQRDLKNIAEVAPGSDVYFKVLLGGTNTAAWPASNKFGAEEEIIDKLIPLAKKFNLNPRGISFHVGSQQIDVTAWNRALAKVSQIFKEMHNRYNIVLDLVNLGGGLPTTYSEYHMNLSQYAQHINGYLTQYFPNGLPSTIMMEPGRTLFANSGVLATSVILVSKKEKDALLKWLYIDASIYNGLNESLGEKIKYPLYSEAEGVPSDSFIIAGNTCDSTDIIYKDDRPFLPDKIKIGDKIYFFSVGAYSTTYCSTDFNGYPPAPYYVINTNEIED